MVDLTVTAASVVPTTTTKRLTKVASEAIDAGEAVYLNASDQLVLADNDASAASAAAIGIALASAAANQPCPYTYDGGLTVGAILTLGTTYILSSTAGKIAPIADVASGDYVTILGVASSTSVLDVHIHASGVALA